MNWSRLLFSCSILPWTSDSRSFASRPFGSKSEEGYSTRRRSDSNSEEHLPEGKPTRRHVPQTRSQALVPSRIIGITRVLALVRMRFLDLAGRVHRHFFHTIYLIADHTRDSKRYTTLKSASPDNQLVVIRRSLCRQLYAE